jgi:DNA-binding beta-propeller fold protein YncE
VTADRDGRVYVADAAGGSVFVVEPEGLVSRQLRPPADPRGFRPVGVACTADRLFVVNAAAHCLDVFRLASGDWLAKFGERDTSAPGLQFPVAAATGPDGRVYVVDMLNARVQIFDEANQPAGAIGQPGNRVGQLARPRGVAVGPDGIVYVCDAATQTVQMFDAQGRVLMCFGGAGSSRGSMALPAGVSVDRSLLEVFADDIPAGFAVDYLVLVANQISEKGIGVYAVGMFARDRTRIAGEHGQP